MKKIYLFTLLFLVPAFNCMASHFVAIDLNYTHLSGSTYKITLTAYADCGTASAGAFALLPYARPQICIFDSTDYYTNFGLVTDTPANPYNGLEVTPVCPSDTDMTQCTNPSYTIPGIKKFIYTGTFTLSHASHYWRIIFAGNLDTSGFAGRAAAITNLVAAASTTTVLVDTLDNTTYNNSSPVFTIIPTPYYCLNQADTYYPSAIDPDGDSLDFSLVPAKTPIIVACTASDSSVAYVTPYNGSNPLGVATGYFTMNPANGLISFTPNITQRALVVYSIREYRGGALIGTSQREMTFLVWSCTGTPASGAYYTATAGTIADSNHFNICAGTGPYSITIPASEADTANRIYVHAWGLPPGASVTTVSDSTNHPISTFSWSTSGITPGTYPFYITYSDDACTFYGSVTRTFYVTILPVPGTLPAIMGHSTVCLAGSDTLQNSFTGGIWSISNTSIATIDSVAPGMAVVTGIAAGPDTAIYTFSNVCGTSSTSFPVMVVPDSICTAGLNTTPNNSAGSIIIVPNPNCGAFSIEIQSPGQEEADIFIANTLGELVAQQTTTTHHSIQVIATLPCGVYFITANTATQHLTARMVILK